VVYRSPERYNDGRIPVVVTAEYARGLSTGKTVSDRDCPFNQNGPELPQEFLANLILTTEPDGE
jgi:hypothetical protein